MALIAVAKVLNDGCVDLVVLRHSRITALSRGYTLFLAVIAGDTSQTAPFCSPLLGLFPP